MRQGFYKWKRVSVESVKTALQELGVTLKYNQLLKEIEVDGLPGLRAALVNGVCSETGILQMSFINYPSCLMMSATGTPRPGRTATPWRRSPSMPAAWWSVGNLCPPGSRLSRRSGSALKVSRCCHSISRTPENSVYPAPLHQIPGDIGSRYVGVLRPSEGGEVK